MHITMPVFVIIQTTGHYIIKSRKRARVNVTKHMIVSYVLTVTTMYAHVYVMCVFIETGHMQLDSTYRFVP